MTHARPRILVIGPTGGGKTTAARSLAQVTRGRWAETGDVIRQHMGIPRAVYEATKRTGGYAEEAFRKKLYDFGKKLCEQDPAFLVRECLKHANVVAGVRRKDELVAARELVDFTIYVTYRFSGPGATDDLSPYDADQWIETYPSGNKKHDLESLRATCFSVVDDWRKEHPNAEPG